MESITGITLPEILNNHFGKNDVRSVRSGKPYKVNSFSDLVRVAAEISCLNPTITTLYRGQRREWLDGDKTTLFPSIYRWTNGKKPSDTEMKKRIDTLHKMTWALREIVSRAVEKNDVDEDSVNHLQLNKRDELIWAVLQHYEYCPTPYLDVTQSLRMACMFALDGAQDQDRPCVYVLGLPFVYDKFFRDSTSELSIIRLLSAMPPVAKRAYYQEGYLIGSELELYEYGTKHDASHRLLAKFELDGDKSTWVGELSTFARKDIYSDDFFSQIKPRVFEAACIEDASSKTIDHGNQSDRFPAPQ